MIPARKPRTRRCLVPAALALFVATTVLFVLCAVSAEAAGGVLLVRHLKGQSMDAGKAVLLTDLVIEDLRSTGQFEKIYSMSDLEAMLTQLGEQQKVDAECDSTKCLLEYGNALGAERVLSGNVGKLGSLAVVSLTLFDTRAGSTEASRTWKCDCSEEVLAERISGYAREIFGLETPAQREARLAAEQRAREDVDRRAKEAKAAADAKLKAEREAVEAQRKAEELRRTLGMEFVRIPGGEFDMGSNETSNEKPVHRVRVSAFSIAKTEVTQAQWVSVMGGNPSNFKGCDDCPVEKVSWNDVQEFLRKANAQTGLSLRLPTEAEWEYAAGGGAQHQKWAGTNSGNELGGYAWYDANSGSKTHPVCQKRPNQFGLCDMSGNVWEWVSDWYANNYSGSSSDNPTGPSNGSIRVNRGGSWYHDAGYVRVAFRDYLDPGDRYDYLGFRLALSQ